MAIDKAGVIEALRGIRDAGTGRDIVEIGGVKKAACCDGYVSVTLGAPDDAGLRASLREAAESMVREAAGRAGQSLKQVTIDFVAQDAPADDTEPVRQVAADRAKQAAASPTIRAGRASAAAPSIQGVKHIIAVGAGKGGVGKSTVSVNLAVGLARRGHAVGLLDGDIYGPSAPTLLGLQDLDVMLLDRMIQPFPVHGIKAMTMGKLVEADKPLIWRGPMAHGAFKQMTEQTHWGELDYLIIDLPPGTGDVPLTMAQLLNVTGAVIVCTPQKVAQDDAVRAARMFQQLNVHILGVVENMSFFIGDDGKEYDLFGKGGAEQMAQRLDLPFLGGLPLNMALRQNSDAGDPTRNFTDAGETLREAFERMIDNVERQAALAGLRAVQTAPTLSVS
jgi:ATP-binding protein involved in chromosome partitioning